MHVDFTYILHIYHVQIQSASTAITCFFVCFPDNGSVFFLFLLSFFFFCKLKICITFEVNVYYILKNSLKSRYVHYFFTECFCNTE